MSTPPPGSDSDSSRSDDLENLGDEEGTGQAASDPEEARPARMSPMSGNEDFPLPDDLLEPEDDGGADQVPGTTVPSVALTATNGMTVDLSRRAG